MKYITVTRTDARTGKARRIYHEELRNVGNPLDAVVNVLAAIITSKHEIAYCVAHEFVATKSSILGYTVAFADEGCAYVGVVTTDTVKE